MKLNSKVLESSNVNSVETLVNLVEHSRSYDMKVKLISTAKEIDTETARLMRNDR
jgi:flagellar basal-body rod protein FlgF